MKIPTLFLSIPLATALALLCLDASAQAKDPLSSAECKGALAALQQQEMRVAEMAGDTGAAAFKQAFAQLQTYRQTAAQDCLGGANSAATQPRSVPRAPVSVGPVNSAVVRPPLPAANTAGQARAAPDPLRSVTSCDAAGCWASDGTRLQRLGPNLVGPGGVCTVQGAVLSCP